MLLKWEEEDEVDIFVLQKQMFDLVTGQLQDTNLYCHASIHLFFYFFQTHRSYEQVKIY